MNIVLAPRSLVLYNYGSHSKVRRHLLSLTLHAALLLKYLTSQPLFRSFIYIGHQLPDCLCSQEPLCTSCVLYQLSAFESSLSLDLYSVTAFGLIFPKE